MKPGTRVTYVDPHGVRVGASVVAVVGTGASTYKVLDLYTEAHVESSVAAEQDAAAGEAFWTLDGADGLDAEPITPAVLDALANDEQVGDLDLPSAQWIDLPDE